MSTLEQFFSSTIAELRPSGWFTSPLFDDVEPVCRLYPHGTDADAVWWKRELNEEALALHFSGLLAMDRKLCFPFEMHSAGANHDPGHYQILVKQLLSCVASLVGVEERWIPSKDGTAAVVPVKFVAALHGRWRPGPSDGADLLTGGAQLFAPGQTWSDFVFFEQLLSRLLREKSDQVLCRVENDADSGLLIFPPGDRAAEALKAFEKDHFSEPSQRSEPMATALSKVTTAVSPSSAEILHQVNLAGHLS